MDKESRAGNSKGNDAKSGKTTPPLGATARGNLPPNPEIYPKLVGVISELANSRTMNDIMRIVRRSARELAGSDGATFVLRDDDSCYYADEDAVSPLWKGRRFPITSCISGFAMLHKEVVAIKDISVDERVPQDVYQETFVKSLVIVPIKIKDPIGAIGNYWATPHEATAEEIEVLQALAEVVAVTIENVQLYSALENRVKELDSTSRAKDEFLMILSHELRTPLNSILGWTKTLLDEEPKEVKDLREGLRTIEKSATTQLRIVEDLLDISRIIAGRLFLEKKPVDLDKVLREAIESVSPAATDKNISLRMERSPYSNIVTGDHGKLVQVLQIVLANAIKFTPANGVIQVLLDREQGFSRMQVVDNGEGMHQEILPFIFDRFRQADSTMRRKHGGLGLGLAIAKHLVEAHGGRIQVDSGGLGRGSSFTVFVPISAVDMLNPVNDSSRSPHQVLEDVTVLAVDDSPEAVELLNYILTKKGAKVLISESVNEGVKAVRNASPDVVVCDLSMPGEDGYSFIKRVRAMGNRVPAIALTAFADKQHELEALGSGFDLFLTKPVNPTLLVDRLRMLVESRRRLMH